MAKKLDKKSWIVIGATFVIMAGIAGYSIYNLKKAKEEAELIDEHYYAQQSTVTTPTSTEATTTQETTEIISTDPYLADWIARAKEDIKNGNIDPEDPNSTADDHEANHDQYIVFNVKEDANSENSLIDLDTVSIDGHIIDLPSTYTDVAKYFKFNDPDYTPDTMIDYGATLLVQATTGIGEIRFTFYCGDSPKPLKDCELREIQISSYNYDSSQYNMTMSMPGNIKFGDTYEDINKKMIIVHDEYSSSDIYWTNIFEKDGMYYAFFGANNGLVTVNIKYTPTAE